MSTKDSATPVSPENMRLHFIDTLRVGLTLLVVAHHAGQAYGPTGGSWPITNPQSSQLLSPFFAVNAMFFMGLFFLISGYFIPGAYDRRGAIGFLKTRFIRLGIPTLFFAFFIFGPVFYLVQSRPLPILEYIKYLHKTGWQELYAHLWFLMHLLLYSCAYIIWRMATDRWGLKDRVQFKLPNHIFILVFAFVLTAITWIVRIWYPLDQWKPLMVIIPSEVAHLPQYVCMFVVGILAYRGDWLRKLPTATGLVWLAIGLLATGAFYAYDLSGGDILEPLLGSQVPYGIIAKGGANWKSLVFSAWEAFICTGLGVGLLVLCRQLLNKPPKAFSTGLIGAQYGVYIIHLLVVIGIQALLQDIVWPPFAKFISVTLMGATVCFGVAYLLKQIPVVKRII
jgi:fucose 4-O-acetylase-like acetyltransferase